MLLPSKQLQPLLPHSSETETDACLLQSSPLPFAGAGDTKPPSYFHAFPLPNSISPSPSLEPEPDDLEQIRPFLVTPGTYVFKSITPTVTCLLPKDSGSPSQAIYHILTERLAISQVMLITIRQGPPDKGGKAVATFELDGRDTIIIGGKRYNRSKIFSVVPGITSKYTRQLFCEFGDYLGRWTRDLSYPGRRVILCHRKMGSSNSTRRTFARLWLADKMRSVWDPSVHLEDPELEIFPDGLERLDDHLVCAVVMMLEKPEMIAKLFTL